MIKLFKLGSELTAQEQRYVLRHYVDRYTGEHTPAWRTTHSMQFANDADWLAHTRFAVTRYGRLDLRAAHCESAPTWPNNPELRVNPPSRILLDSKS